MEHLIDEGNLSNLKYAGHEEASVSLERPLEGWHGRRLSSAERAKVIDILAACKLAEKTHLLTTLATSEAGLVDDEVRRVACGFMTGDETTGS